MWDFFSLESLPQELFRKTVFQSQKLNWLALLLLWLRNLRRLETVSYFHRYFSPTLSSSSSPLTTPPSSSLFIYLFFLFFFFAFSFLFIQISFIPDYRTSLHLWIFFLFFYRSFSLLLPSAIVITKIDLLLILLVLWFLWFRTIMLFPDIFQED